jgi:hypothetical protein
MLPQDIDKKATGASLGCSVHQADQRRKMDRLGTGLGTAKATGEVPVAYFSPSWTVFQAERGRDFSVIVDGISN